MPAPVHILGFAGSLRRGSFNAGALRAALGLLPEGVSLEIFDLRPLPMYDGDVEAEAIPEPVLRFKQRIAAADALLIATPEYNHSMPAVLKNAIDWASRPHAESALNGKPAAIMGAGGRFGTVRAQAHLRAVASATNMLVLPRPEVLIQNVNEKFDAEGTLLDEPTRRQIAELLAALATWTRRLRRS